ncbi:efflux transporter periplasmic adaptor subunit, partial [filamentous cyanobacterium CCP5]
AQLTGVDTQRPKPEALAQAEAQLRSATAAREATAAQVAQVRSDLDQARRDRARAEDLYKEGAISRRELESAQLEATRQGQELEAAQQDLQQAIAAVTTAQEAIPLLRAEQQDPDYLIRVYQAQMAAVEAELANLADEAQRTTITAPVAGTVLRVPEASARYVQAGDSLLDLGNPADLELVIDVLSADAVKIQPGDRIWVEQWGGEPLAATVSRVEPSAFTEVSALGVEEQRVNIIGQFADPVAAALGDGYRTEARIVIWSDDHALQVPVSALYRCAQDWCVFVVDEGRAQERPITVGQRSTTAAAIATGLEPGEQVILHPSEEIEVGDRVELR